MPRRLLTTGFLALLLSSCASPVATPGTTQLVNIEVAGSGADAEVRLTFSAPVSPGLPAYAELHEGTIRGRLVPVRITLSDERTVLRLAGPIRHEDQYVLHLGGAVRDAAGDRIDLETHFAHLGLRWVSVSAFGDGKGYRHPGHREDAWRHPNGYYGVMRPITVTR